MRRRAKAPSRTVVVPSTSSPLFVLLLLLLLASSWLLHAHCAVTATTYSSDENEEVRSVGEDDSDMRSGSSSRRAVSCMHSNADTRARLYAHVHGHTAQQQQQQHSRRNDHVDRNNSSSPHASPSSPLSFAPIRIHVDTSNLYRGDVVCSAAGQLRGDLLGGRVTCSDDDVVDDALRELLVQHVLVRAVYAAQRLFDVRRRHPPLQQQEQQRHGADADDAQHGARLRVAQGVCGPQLHIPAAHTRDGVAAADVIVYAAAVPATHGTIAWAGYCNLDARDDDRPVVARLNVAPRQLRRALGSQQQEHPRVPPPLQQQQQYDGDDDSSDRRRHRRRSDDDALSVAHDAAASVAVVERYVRYVLHELLHALGFAPPFLTRVSHRDAVSAAAAATTSTPHAGDDNVRIGGNNNSSSNRVVSRYVVTAAPVVAAARTLLSCTSLAAVALEADGGGGTAGMHWERRTYRDELMVGVPDANTAALSSLTLAFFASLPFYRVHMQYAQRMTWGSNAGCAFARTSSCHAIVQTTTTTGVTKDTHSNNNNAGSSSSTYDAQAASLLLLQSQRPYWCEATSSSSSSDRDTTATKATRQASVQCTYDYRSIGTCSAPQLTPSPLMEGCAAVEPVPHMHCSSSSIIASSSDKDEDEQDVTTTTTTAAHAPPMRVYTGSQSRCVRTLLLPPSSSHDNDDSASPPQQQQQQETLSAMCVRVRCVGGVRVQMQLHGVWLSCPADGSAQWLDVPSFLSLPDSAAPSSSSARRRHRVWCAAAATMCTPALYAHESAPGTAALHTTRGNTNDDKNTAPLREYVVLLRLSVAVATASATATTTRTTATSHTSHAQQALSSSSLSMWHSPQQTRQLVCDVVSCCSGALRVALLQDIAHLLRVDVDAYVGAREGAVRALSPDVAVVLATAPHAVHITTTAAAAVQKDADNNGDDDERATSVPLAVVLPLAITAGDEAALRRVVRVYTQQLQAAQTRPLPHTHALVTRCTRHATRGTCPRDVLVFAADAAGDDDEASHHRPTMTTMTRLGGDAVMHAGERGSDAMTVVDEATAVVHDLIAVAEVNAVLHVVCERNSDSSGRRHQGNNDNNDKVDPSVCARMRVADAVHATALQRDMAALLGITDSMLRVVHMSQHTPDVDDAAATTTTTTTQQVALIVRALIVVHVPSSLLMSASSSTVYEETTTSAAQLRSQWQRWLQYDARVQRMDKASSLLLQHVTHVLRQQQQHATLSSLLRPAVLLARAAVTSPTATVMRDVAAGVSASYSAAVTRVRGTSDVASCGEQSRTSLLRLLRCLRARYRSVCAAVAADDNDSRDGGGSDGSNNSHTLMCNRSALVAFVALLLASFAAVVALLLVVTQLLCRRNSSSSPRL